MAGLSAGCCLPTVAAACCAPEAKDACCGQEDHAGGACGCATGARPESAGVRKAARPHDAATGGAAPTPMDGAVVREAVRSHYAAIARMGGEAACALGCGAPAAVADLREGETVLDLGSGAGADVLRCAELVGPTGKAYGVEMTEEMLERARRAAAEAGAANVEFLAGYIEDVPLPDGSVDVVISNCVINLAADKQRVLAEAARVLRPGGRLAMADIVADADMDAATRADLAAWTSCIAGALTRTEYERALAAAGFVDVEITETHRVHDHAGAAIVLARKP